MVENAGGPKQFYNRNEAIYNHGKQLNKAITVGLNRTKLRAILVELKISFG